MSNMFKDAGDRIRSSPFILVIWFAFVLYLIISVVLMVESYTTSVRGYAMLPTAKANAGIVIPMVGLLPMVGQIVFFYTFAANTQKTWALIIGAVLHIFDVGTDVVYKAQGSADPIVWAIALFESEILFTVGAVIGFTFAAGTLLEITPDLWRMIGQLGKDSAEGLGVTNSKHGKGGGAAQRGA